MDDETARLLDTESPNYHIHVWDTPPTYLCLLCEAMKNQPLATILTHLIDVHNTAPVPTILASMPETLRPEVALMTANAPTYYTANGPDGKLRYYCCYCEVQGSEHWATDFALFEGHMATRHDGRLAMDEERSTGTEEGDGGEDVPAAEQPSGPAPPVPADASGEPPPPETPEG
jgi:hypothetical protein